MVMTLPGEEYLNPFYLDKELRTVMEPQLYFNGILPNTDTTERAFMYDVIENSAYQDLEDGIMSLPAPGGEEATLTKLEMRNISKVEGKIPKIGYEFDISYETLENKIDTQSAMEIRMKMAGYGIAYTVNALTIQNLLAGARSSTVTPDYAWDSTTGKQTVIKDIIKQFYEFKLKTFGNRGFNWFLNSANHQAMIEWCTNRDIDFSFDALGNTITINDKAALKNMTFTDVEDQITEDNFMIMDLRKEVYPGAETYRYIDRNFAVRKANTEPNQKVPDYTGVHVNITKLDKHPFTHTVEMWLNILPVVKIGDVIMKGNGI